MRIGYKSKHSSPLAELEPTFRPPPPRPTIARRFRRGLTPRRLSHRGLSRRRLSHRVQPTSKPPHLTARPAHDRIRVGSSGGQLDADTLEMYGIGHRKTTSLQPMAQHVALSRHVELAKRRKFDESALDTHLREIFHRERLEQCPCLTEMRSAPRGDTRHRRPTLTQHGQHASSQKIPIEALIDVAVVLDPREPSRTHERLELGSRLVKQGTHQAPHAKGHISRHRSQARHARAPHQLQQQRLELIVFVMGREQPLVTT